MRPDEKKPAHPGKALRDALYSEGSTFKMTHDKLAKHLGVTRATIQRLLHEKSDISPTMAVRLGRALNTDPEYWLFMQARYDLWIAINEGTHPDIKIAIPSLEDEPRLRADMVLYYGDDKGTLDLTGLLAVEHDDAMMADYLEVALDGRGTRH